MRSSEIYGLIAECEDYERSNDDSIDKLCKVTRSLVRENKQLISIMRRLSVIDGSLSDEEWKLFHAIQGVGMSESESGDRGEDV